MKSMSRIVRQFSLFGASCLFISLATTSGSSAFPATGQVPKLQAGSREVTATVTQPVSAQKESSNRSPLILRIGARQQLFDGDFLCEVSDRPRHLNAAGQQF